VLWTPPYHSDFQPIELVWALIKGNVGRQYNNETTLKIVHDRLMHEFDELEASGHDSVAGMIEKCARVAKVFYDRQQEEEGDEVVSDSEEEGEEDGGSENGYDDDDDDGQD
jgi:hypothetical protein